MVLASKGRGVREYRLWRQRIMLMMRESNGYGFRE
jgi:hypothetical protein